MAPHLGRRGGVIAKLGRESGLSSKKGVLRKA